MEENLNQTPVNNDAGIGESSGFPIKKVLSLVIGLIVFIAIIVAVFMFLLPRFLNSKPTNATIVYWGAWESVVPYKTIADEFMKKNPGIKVKVEMQDIKSLGKYVDRLITRANNGTGPDVFRFHNSWVTEINQILLPLPQSVVDATEVNKKYYSVVDSDLKVKGAYYGVPTHYDALALFVNPEIFKNAGIQKYPTSWDEIYTIAPQLTVKDSDGKIITAGIALGTYDNITHAPDIVSLLFLQNGANLRDLSGTQNPNEAEGLKQKNKAVDGLKFYTSFAKGDANVWDESMDDSSVAFAKGNLAMYIGYSWDIFQIQAINPDLKFIVLPAPHLFERKNTVASYWIEGVSSKTKYPKQAFEFLKFLVSKESLEQLYAQEAKTRAFGELYPRTDMADLLKSNKIIYPFVQQGKDAVSTIFSSNTYDDAMTDSLNVYLGNAVRSVVGDNTSEESAIDTLSAGVDQVYSRYGEPQEE